MSAVDGIYTAYLTGVAGQGMAMFVFKDGKISGADVAGLVFSGSYNITNKKLIGEVVYQMPAGSTSITGASFDQHSDNIVVPLELPEIIDPTETYRINTPIGPLNAKFVKNTGFGETDAN
ncbi:MAG: hypothetical protein KDJ62_07000 [Rhodobiaceae bacterium]|nr:hypothetical protein [Rhodobiaceae bacterium]MCC0049449.1 hypothetical protein [Rhodobiaceae bacterium]